MAATAAEHDHTSLALATWALGKLSHSPSAQLAAALRRRMAEVAAACNPQNLTNFVSGFAMMGCPLAGDDLEVRKLTQERLRGGSPSLVPSAGHPKEIAGVALNAGVWCALQDGSEGQCSL